MFDENKLKRKSPRATFHNYSNGDYYITICTKSKKHYLGEIIAGEMYLNAIGEYCKSRGGLIIRVAKLLQNVEKSYDKGKFLLDESEN